MGRFAFRGSHESEQKIVTGVVEASTRADALAQLARRSIKVTNLDPIAPSESGRITPPAEVKSATPSGRLSPPPAKTEERVLDRKGLAMAGLLLGLGCLYLLGGSRAAPAARPDKATVRIKVFGRLEMPVGLDVSQVQAQVHLSDIPLDEFRSGKNWLDDQGNFAIEFTVGTPIQPDNLVFTVKAGKTMKVDLQKLHLTRQADGVLACNLSTLHLSPAPARPSPAPWATSPLARSAPVQATARVPGPQPDRDGSPVRRRGDSP